MSRIEIIGVYAMPGLPDVHLIEIVVQASPKEVDLSSFVHEDPSLPSDSWQAAYDERYLNSTGDEVSGDFLSIPEGDTTRIVFFMHFLSFDRPLRTPYGPVTLPSPVELPERLSKIIEYEPVD